MSRDMQRARSEKVRQEIIDTALEIALEEGFESLSIRKICQRMGYSTGVVYYHFRDKQEVIEAIQVREGAWLGEQIRKAVRPEMGAMESLYAAFHCVMCIAHENAARYSLIVTQRHRHGEAARPGPRDMLTATIQQGMDRGELRPGDAALVAQAIWSAFLGLHLVISQQQNLPLEEAERKFDALFEIIRRGISSGA